MLMLKMGLCYRAPRLIHGTGAGLRSYRLTIVHYDLCIVY